MSTVRWTREHAVSLVDPLELDELDSAALVLDGVSRADDDALGWVRRAPCVVLAMTPPGAARSEAVDLALDSKAAEQRLDELAARATERPAATRTLAEVLRVSSALDTPSGLLVESLAYSMLLAGPEFASWRSASPSPGPKHVADPPVRIARDGPDLLVTLARPQNRNAMSAAMRDALVEALTVATIDDSVAGVVLAGDGPAFCSGGDLSEFGTASDVVGAHGVRTRRNVGALLDVLSSRTTARVHGTCVGAGVELPAFAGRVVAAGDATFRLPEVAMGLIPGAGGTVSLPRRIGRQATLELALSGRSIDAVEARSLGLVDEIE